MPSRYSSRPVPYLKILGIVLGALAVAAIVWPIVWTLATKGDERMLLFAGEFRDVQQLVAFSLGVTFAIALLRSLGSEPSELVLPAAGILASLALLGGGWSATLGLALLAIAALLRPALGVPTSGDPATNDDD